MTASSASIRRLPAVLFAFLSFAATALHAQVVTPPSPDSTAVQDSLLRVDSIRRAQTPRDTTPILFPALGAVVQSSFPDGIWVWDQEALLREGATTLGDLLRRIPSLTAFRAGGYLQPEAGSAFGQARGRVEVELDGYILDPLDASTYDLAQVELINLASVRVDRRLDVTRIRLVTAQPAQGTPYTRLEASTGDPDMNTFRALFLVPYAVVGPLGIALDRVDTDGLERAEPANSLTGWAKWSWTNGRRGLQMEFRRQSLQRSGLTPWPFKGSRQDVILRARSTFFDGFTAELFGGQSRIDRDTDTMSAVDEDSPVPQSLKREHWQAGGRAAFTRGGASLEGSLRLRNADALPSQELGVRGSLDVASLLHFGGDFSQQAWKSGAGASSFDVRAQVGPMQGVGAFVEYADGDRGAPLYSDSIGFSTRESHALSTRTGMRAGALLERFGIRGGIAYVKLDAETTPPFGLPFDSASVDALVDPATGAEMWGRLGMFRDRLAIDATYTYWQEAAGWTYLPQRSWRVAGELHLSPLPSGNLEVFSRIESVRRGSMLAFSGVAGEPEPGSTDLRFVSLPAATQLNGYLQIRIINVRAYVQFEDMFGTGRLDIPERAVRGPRFYYGVKWQLFN